MFPRVILYKCSGILEDMVQFFHVKQLSVLQKKTKALRNDTPAKYIVLERQPFPDVYKKGPFKNFLNLTRKHLQRNLHLAK